jgi:ABC-type multidrug transport system fused ATPase/permease subunit
MTTSTSTRSKRPIYGDLWAWCFRIPKLFTGTVKENIRYGKLDATDEEIIAAAKLANADRIHPQLPQGYDTVLEPKPASTYRKASASFFRSPGRDCHPPVMILDEATSRSIAAPRNWFRKAWMPS